MGLNGLQEAQKSQSLWDIKDQYFFRNTGKFRYVWLKKQIKKQLYGTMGKEGQEENSQEVVENFWQEKHINI